MNEYGKVVAVGDNKATVKIKRNSACGDCKACELGMSNLSELNVEVENTMGAGIGDHVRLEMGTPDVLKAAFVVYTIPLMALLIGIVGTYFATGKEGSPNEFLMIAVGFTLMILSGFFVKMKDNKIKSNSSLEPKMIEVKKTLL